ncbi:MAG: hypothetical protein OEX22_03830 [Cyclobacteriaceae bacterium]|nr:hypothetical protein [Cyclobacteriaceae bacterium]
MKRRDFIIGTASIAAISIPSVYFYLNHDDTYDPLIAEPQSLSLIWDTDAIIAIGVAYLRQFPDENSEQILVDKLVNNILGNQKAGKLNNQVRKDFETGNTVLIDGWMLSKTEARQCALLTTKLKKQHAY